MDYSLGVDLGTTYSAAAGARRPVEIFQLGERAATIPSVVVLRADGEVLIGDAAERRALTEPLRTAREFKRRLGDPTPIILGGTPYGAEALIGHLLRAIVAKVAEREGGPPARDRPAPTRRTRAQYKIDLLRQAVRQAGLGTVDARHRAARRPRSTTPSQERVADGAVVAVYDLGGGTFDAAVLRKTDDGFEQLGRPEGIERLGGIDFDEAVFAHVWPPVRGQPARRSTRTTRPTLRRRRPAARGVPPRQGGAVDRHRHDDPGLLPGLQTEVRLTRERVRGDDPAADPRDDRWRSSGRSRSAGLEFAGRRPDPPGRRASRIPLVAEMVREATARPVAVDAHPKHSMALGAAWVAERSRRAAAEPAGAAAAAGLAVAGAAGAPPVVTSASAPTPTSPAGGPPATAGAGSASAVPAGRRPTVAIAAVVALVLVVVIAAGAFAFLPRGGSTGGTPTPGSSAVGGASLPASPSIAISPSPSVASLAPASPTATPAPTPTPTPSGKQARILGITVSGGRYVVDYQVFGYTQKLPGEHVHFFFNTVPPTQAGMPGKGPWYVYAGPIPFKGYKLTDRPSKATQMCILYAHPDHSVVQNTGNCVDLPG